MWHTCVCARVVALIHRGVNSPDQAVIQLALHWGAKVATTANTVQDTIKLRESFAATTATSGPLTVIDRSNL